MSWNPIPAVFGRHEDGRHWLKVSSAASLAIPFALSPIWTRLFTVEDFAIASLALVVPGLVSTWSTLAFHSAIQTPNEDRAAFALVELSSVITLAVCAILLVTVMLFGDAISSALLGATVPSWLLWLAAPSIIATMVGVTLDEWMIRKGDFRGVANAQLLQAFSAPVMLTIFAGARDRINVVLLAAISSAILGLIARVWLSGAIAAATSYRISFFELKACAKEYRRFPRDASFSNVLTSVAVQLPVVVLGRTFGVEAVGHYARARTLLSMPVSLLVRPATAVFAREGGMAFRTRGEFVPELLASAKTLLVALLPTYLVIGALSPWLYPWFYGPAWAETGRLAQPLAASLLIGTLVSPFAEAFNFARRTGTNVAWQVLRLILLAAALALGARSGSALGLLWWLVGANVVAYAVCAWLIWRVASAHTATVTAP